MVVPLLIAGGGSNEKVNNAQQAEQAADRRADAPRPSSPLSKARVEPADGDLQRGPGADRPRQAPRRRGPPALAASCAGR